MDQKVSHIIVKPQYYFNATLVFRMRIVTIIVLQMDKSVL